MTDDEDFSRARQTVAQRDRLLISRLRPMTRGYERAFLNRDPADFDAFDRRLLARLQWHYRGSLPAPWRLVLNPEDPIVQEQQNAA